MVCGLSIRKAEESTQENITCTISHTSTSSFLNLTVLANSYESAFIDLLVKIFYTFVLCKVIHCTCGTILQAVQVMKRPSADPSAAGISSLAQAGLAQGLAGGRSGTARGGTRKEAK
jgi:ABC-type Fe3+-siderophore transport system permease subunit